MRFRKLSILGLPTLLLLLTALTVGAQAQSLEISAPSPVRTNEVVGRIAARDIGDARLTDHYYAFTGNQGDLLITVEGKNLNGDIDVFTVAGLRPLLKFTVYAESPAPIAKTIFLRRREGLILRVEGRTPNDDDGTYQISFGGSFEPIAGGPFLAENETRTEDTLTATSRPTTKGRRVSSSGARIYEPEPPAEVATAPTPEPSPEPSPSETAETKTEATAPVEAAKSTSRSARARRPTSRRTPTRSKPSADIANKAEDTTVTEQPTESPTESTAPVNPTAPGRRNRRRASSRTPTEAVAPPEPVAAQRLVIETRSGTLVDLSMADVRRVMVENGQVVVVGKDGKIQRIALVDVVRMSIAP